MNILFVTSYDELTAANLVIANKIISATDTALFSNSATRYNLHSLIESSNNFSVMAMSHGDYNLLKDNDRIYAIHVDDAHVFSDIKFFVWACNTGKILGKSISSNGNIWWGYDSLVTVPDVRPKYLDIFSAIFKEVKNIFPDGVDESSVNLILNSIKQACDLAIDRIDSLVADDDDDVFSLYSCCLNIWKSLCVWLPQATHPLKHPEAIEFQLDI